jgi:hypothetical protein
LGFYDEAKELLNSAKAKENVNENVWSSLDDLAKRQKHEEEKSEKIFQKANEDQLYLQKFAVDYFDPNSSIIDISGNWQCNSETVQLKQLANNQYFQFSWTIDQKSFSITLKIEKNLAIIGNGSYEDKGGGLTKDLLVFANLSKDNKQLSLLLYDTWELTSYVYSFSKS